MRGSPVSTNVANLSAAQSADDGDPERSCTAARRRRSATGWSSGRDRRSLIEAVVLQLCLRPPRHVVLLRDKDRQCASMRASSDRTVVPGDASGSEAEFLYSCLPTSETRRTPVGLVQISSFGTVTQST
jgi:hypothetical protein